MFGPSEGRVRDLLGFVLEGPCQRLSKGLSGTSQGRAGGMSGGAHVRAFPGACQGLVRDQANTPGWRGAREPLAAHAPSPAAPLVHERPLACAQVVLADEACANCPHNLRGLLATLGLPIASARVPRAVERSILALTPGAVALTPALVRSHLASSRRSSSSAAAAAHGRGGSTEAAALAGLLLRHQLHGPKHDGLQSAAVVGSLSSAQQEPKGTETDAALGANSCPSTAALLLDYCLSDLDLGPLPNRQSSQGASSRVKQEHPRSSANHVPSPAVCKALADLHGLPLLPLADGQLGMLHTAAAAGAGREAGPAGGGGNVAGRMHDPSGQQVEGAYVLPSSHADLELLAPVPGLCLAHTALPDGLPLKLRALADRGARACQPELFRCATRVCVFKCVCALMCVCV